MDPTDWALMLQQTYGEVAAWKKPDGTPLAPLLDAEVGVTDDGKWWLAVGNAHIDEPEKALIAVAAQALVDQAPMAAGEVQAWATDTFATIVKGQPVDDAKQQVIASAQQKKPDLDP